MSSEKFRRASGLRKSNLGSAAGRWHGVSVVTQGDCCSSASMLQQSRFLSAEAPSLPLPGCPVKDSCRCFYKHHEDRREQLRRREEITGLRSNVRIANERRLERDRRRSDGW